MDLGRFLGEPLRTGYQSGRNKGAGLGKMRDMTLYRDP